MYKRILVPIDGSPASQRGLDEALMLSKHGRVRLRLLHVVGLFISTPALAGAQDLNDIPQALRESGLKILKDAEARARRRGVTVDVEMVNVARGRAADAIVAQAKKWRANLIVIGTHGRRGLKRLALGSDAEKVVRISPVPVLTVRTAGTSRR